MTLGINGTWRITMSNLLRLVATLFAITILNAFAIVNPDIHKIGVGSNFACVLDNNNVRCWGESSFVATTL